jgi:hypothetical protein
MPDGQTDSLTFGDIHFHEFEKIICFILVEEVEIKGFFKKIQIPLDK